MNNEQKPNDMPSIPVDADPADIEVIDLTGFQVTRAELFAHVPNRTALSLYAETTKICLSIWR